MGLLRAGRHQAEEQPHGQSRVALRRRHESAEQRVHREPARRPPVPGSREPGGGASRQRRQQPPAAVRLCLGHQERRADGGARRIRLVFRPQPPVVQHPRRRREQPVHGRGHESRPAPQLSEPAGGPRRAYARGLHSHRRWTRPVPARRRSQPAVRAQRDARRRHAVGPEHLARSRSHPPGAEGPADRPRREPAGARAAVTQPAAVSPVFVGHTDQQHDGLDVRRLADAVQAALPGNELAGVLHVREGDLEKYQRQRQLQHRSVEHVRQRRSRSGRKRPPSRAVDLGDQPAPLGRATGDHRLAAHR